MNDNDAAFRRRWSADTMRLMPAMERNAAKVHRLGARVMLELILELAAEHDCIDAAAVKLAGYATLTPTMIRDAGADRFIPRRPVLVPT
jgi:hypothetical protein